MRPRDRTYLPSATQDKQMARARKLDAAIAANLKELGYGG